MRKYKYCKVGFFMLFLVSWLALSPVAFFGDFNKAHEQISDDGQYRAVAYYVLPTTPISLFQWAFSSDIFLVLYDKHGNYLGQSSPFRFTDQYIVFGNDVFFPDEIDGNEKSFSINGVNDFVEGYTIQVNHKRWWSQIISIFH